jgi:hypothetical protein
MQSPGEWGGETTNLLQASLREFRFFSANPASRGSSMPPKQSVNRHSPIFPDPGLPINPFLPSMFISAIGGYKKFPPMILLSMILPTIILP